MTQFAKSQVPEKMEIIAKTRGFLSLSPNSKTLWLSALKLSQSYFKT
jgi:hypothetical protein